MSPAKARAGPRIERLIASLLGARLSLMRACSRTMQNAGTRDNPEIVHKARVSVRRMRATLKVFGAVLEHKTAVRRAERFASIR